MNIGLSPSFGGQIYFAGNNQKKKIIQKLKTGNAQNTPWHDVCKALESVGATIQNTAGNDSASFLLQFQGGDQILVHKPHGHNLTNTTLKMIREVLQKIL